MKGFLLLVLLYVASQVHAVTLYGITLVDNNAFETVAQVSKFDTNTQESTVIVDKVYVYQQQITFGPGVTAFDEAGGILYFAPSSLGSTSGVQLIYPIDVFNAVVKAPYSIKSGYISNMVFDSVHNQLLVTNSLEFQVNMLTSIATTGTPTVELVVNYTAALSSQGKGFGTVKSALDETQGNFFIVDGEPGFHDIYRFYYGQGSMSNPTAITMVDACYWDEAVTEMYHIITYDPQLQALVGIAEDAMGTLYYTEYSFVKNNCTAVEKIPLAYSQYNEIMGVYYDLPTSTAYLAYGVATCNISTYSKASGFATLVNLGYDFFYNIAVIA